MNTPNFRFTVISDLDLISTLGAVGTEWTDGTGSDPWTNGTGKIENVNTGPGSNTLTRSVSLLRGKKYRCSITYTSAELCQFQLFIGFSDATSYSVYLLNASSQASPRIMTFEFQVPIVTVNALDPDKIIIVLSNASVGLDFSFSQILLQEIDSLTRVIAPGGWKGLTKTLERIPKYYGFIETLEGSIDLSGGDLEFMKLYPPLKQFKCKVEISVGGASFEDFYTGILDTVKALGKGLGSRVYQATFPFLKETEWSKLTSYMDNNIDLVSNKGVHGQDVIDFRGSVDVMWPVVPDGKPRLEMRFKGEAFPTTPITMSSKEILYFGFGDRININDGFKTFIGTSKSDTVSISIGKMVSFEVNVAMSWTTSGVTVEGLNSGGTYTALSGSNVNNNFVFTEGAFSPLSGYQIRLNNFSASSETFELTAIANFEIVAQVEFEFNVLGQMPLLYLKANLARIMGDYDNVIAPIFDDNTLNMVTGIDFSKDLQNPPPRFRPYDADVFSNLPAGNYFMGNDVDWTKSGSTLIANASGRVSNGLIVRFQKSDITTLIYTCYATKGRYLMSINITASSNPSGIIEIFGLIGDTVDDSLPSFTASVGFHSTSVTVDKYYDAIGIRAVDTDVTIDQFDFLPDDVTPGVTRGDFALNYLSTGLQTKRDAAIAVAAEPDTMPQFMPFRNGLDGLTLILGLGMEPVAGTGSALGKPVIYLDKLEEFFTNTVSPLILYAEEYEQGLDIDIIRDSVTVGGPSQQDNPIDQNASCSISNYSTGYNTTRQDSSLRFRVSLNSPLILNQKLENSDLCLIELYSKSLPDDIFVLKAFYRTEQGLTITDSPSPRQFNWVHSEGRIMRRNNALLSSMLNNVFSLTGGVASTQVIVDASDGYGAISNSDPIFPSPFFTPYLVTMETSMTYEDYKTLFANRRNTTQISNGGVVRDTMLKSLKYNAATGKAIASVWLKNAEDVL